MALVRRRWADKRRTSYWQHENQTWWEGSDFYMLRKEGAIALAEACEAKA